MRRRSFLERIHPVNTRPDGARAPQVEQGLPGRSRDWLEPGVRRSGPGRVVRRVRPVGKEDFLDRQVKNVGDGERQGQAGVVPLGLDGVDCLAGDLAPVGQVGLAPPAGCSQLA